MAHEVIAECVTDILTPVFSDLLLTYARQHGLYLFYILKKQLVHIKEVVNRELTLKCKFIYVICRLGGPYSEKLCGTEVLKMLPEAAGRGQHFQRSVAL